MIPAHQLSRFEHASGSIADDYFANADFSDRHIASSTVWSGPPEQSSSLFLRFQLAPNCRRFWQSLASPLDPFTLTLD
jgi:hypothetical protein